MDGDLFRHVSIVGSCRLPGAAFGEDKLPPRPLDRRHGRRGRPAAPSSVPTTPKVSAASPTGWPPATSRCSAAPDPDARIEQARLRNAIATGALLTSGRHLQHGDAGQPGRNMELFTNCATAVASFAKFYLLLNGSGVGRSYDDALMAVDWANAPALLLHLSPTHPDYPARRQRAAPLRRRIGVLPGAPPGRRRGRLPAREC